MDNMPTLAEYIAKQAGVPGASCPNLPNTYIGMRYVPEFADPVEWDATMQTEYEYLKIVTYQGNSYTSRTWVPKNIPITNTDYWILTGNYNAQVEAYRKEVQAFDGRITENKNNIASNSAQIASNTLNIRAANNKIGWVNILAFGGNGNGVDDNTQALATALNNGLPVFFPNGTYAFYSAQSIRNCHLIGTGATIKSKMSNNLGFFTVTNGILEGLKIEGADGYYQSILELNESSARCCTVHNTRSNGVTLRSGYNELTACTITDCNIGVVINSSNNTVAECQINNNSSHGISITGPSSDNMIRNNNINANGGSGIVSSFKNSATGEVESFRQHILDNRITNNLIHGVENRSSFSVIRGNILQSNGTSGGGGTQGIVSQVQHVTISNNNISSQKAAGIDIGNGAYTIVSNNIISNCEQIAIEINFSAGCVVTNNECFGNLTADNDDPTMAAIWVHNGKVHDYWTHKSNNIVISNNYIGAGPKQARAIYTSADSNNIAITGNVYSAEKPNIFVESNSTNTTVANNQQPEA